MSESATVEATAEAPKPTPPPSAPNAGTDGPVRLPDDHPLVTAYATLKSENKALKETANGSKTEAEKVAERLAEVEKRAAEAEARTMRRDVALEFGLSKDDAALLDAVNGEEAMRSLAQRLSSASDKSKKSSNTSPREGITPAGNTTNDEEREFARNLFGGGA